MFGLDSLGGAGGFSGSSAATAQGGTVGSFEFNPKAGVSPWALAAVAALALFLFLRRGK